MNRQQRRAAGIKSKDPVRMMKQSSMSLSDYQDFVYETVGIKFKTTD